MNQQLIIYISELIVACSAGIGLLMILGASLYDIGVTTRRRAVRLVATTLRKPRQPQVTVLLYAKNNSAIIEACLRSIWMSRYRRYDIVVVDNGSTDALAYGIKKYRHKHPNRPLYYYKKRKVSDRLTALRQGYAKSQKGDIILVLDATAVISPLLIREAAARFVTDERLQALQLNEVTREIAGVTLLLNRLLQLSRHIYVKTTTLLTVARVTVGQPNVLYRQSVFVGQHAPVRVRNCYDGTLNVSSSSTDGYRMPAVVSLVGLFFVTYFVYVAASLQSSSLLVASWLVVVIWLLVAIWSDEAAGGREKVALTFCVPPVYFLVYLVIIVDGIRRAAVNTSRRIVIMTRKLCTQPAEQ